MICLHHCHQTRSMRTLWLLYEMGMTFQVVTHAFDKTLRETAYLQHNPAGRVPALEIDGITLFESGAIAEYLCETRADTRLGRRPGDNDRAEWLIWLHFAETISQHVATLTQQHIALYEDHMRSPLIMSLERRRLEKTLGVVGSRLNGREYILDSGFSAADVGVGQAVYMAQHFTPLVEIPNLSSWYERITARPAFKKSLPPPGAKLLYQRDFYETPNG